MKSELRTAIIFGIIIVGVVAGLSASFSIIESENQNTSQITTEESDGKTLNIDKSGFKMAPDIVGIADYINTTPEQLQKEIEGKVVLYDIWTYSCINCIRTLPHITAWDDKYADQGLLIIGIHSPEFEFEKELENVEMAVDKYGINYPVVLDNDKKTWDAFENRYWPRKYIADHEGYIRYDHIGEGKYDETEKVIQQLIEERANQLGLNVASAESLVEIENFEHSNFRTPELYFGYKFAQGRNQLGNDEGFRPGQNVEYQVPQELQLHNFYMDGVWTNLQGSMKLVSNTGSIILPYHAKEVNIVTANEAELSIFIDGEPVNPEIAGSDLTEDSKIIASEPGLYNIISSEEASTHIIGIGVNKPGFEIYTFTFG